MEREISLVDARGKYWRRRTYRLRTLLGCFLLALGHLLQKDHDDLNDSGKRRAMSDTRTDKTEKKPR